MMLAIRALTWEILARHRWIVGASAIWLVVACVIAAVLPDSVRNPNIVAVLLAPSIFGVILFLSTVSYGQETRIETRGGAFPRRLLRLPVSAVVLGGVPLTLVVAVFCLLWAIASVGVLRPCGIVNAPIIWPGLMTGVMFVWLLALCWSSMPSRWVRIALVAILLTTFMSGFGIIEAYEWPEPRIVLCLAALLLPAVGLAIRGVSRSRYEAAYDPETSTLSTPSNGVSMIAPFRSRLRAQLWFEWRTHGRTGFLLTLMMAFILIPTLIMSEYVRRTKPEIFWVLAELTGIDPTWLPLFWSLIIPVILAGAGGGEAGRFAQSQKTIGVPSFVGLMPISTVDLVRGKFIASAIHLALMWGVMLLLTLGWAGFGGHLGGMAERLREGCGSPALAWVALLVAVVGCYAIIYLLNVGSMWMGLLGPPGFASLPVFVGMLAISVVAWIGQHWLADYSPILRAGLWIALVPKLLLAAYLVNHLLMRHRVGAGLLAVALLAWAGLTAASAVVVGWWGGEMWVLAVVVLSPLASCLVTPAFLHRSRHGAWA